ncbi:MAG: DUF983 domain-containing protein [Pseudomonadota bacterium]
MWRGLRWRCPACGVGRLYSGYLKVNHSCDICHQELHHQRADDAPPYFTMFIVGHIVISGVLHVESTWAPPTWVHIALWIPITIIMSLAILPSIKGALIGLQWANRMHGFDDTAVETHSNADQLPTNEMANGSASPNAAAANAATSPSH